MMGYDRRIEDHLFCPNCLLEGKRIIMKPLWKFDKSKKKVYLWFICPHKRKGETGCGHKSIREVSVFISMLRKEYDRREKVDTNRKRKIIKKRLKNAIS